MKNKKNSVRLGRQESGVNLAAQHLPHGSSGTANQVRPQCVQGKSSANIYPVAARTWHPKVFMKTFGCQMNVRDSEVVKGLLLAEGYKLTEEPVEADVVLFNTCSVRQHAEDKVWSAVGQLSRNGRRHQSPVTSHQKKAKPIIGIIGCMAENYKREIFRRAPAVDIVCGPSCIDELPKMIDAVTRSQGHKVTSQKTKEKEFLKTGSRVRPEDIYHTGFHEDKDHAYVVISEGCDNYCSYCVVPYVRGRLRHRSDKDIIEEVKAALESGIENITLLGQNVNSYRCVTRSQSHKVTSKVDFVELLRRVSQIQGLKSLSFITSHPKDIKKALFQLMAERPVIKRYLHLPIQSGSDRILKKMNRGYNAKKYSEIIDLYRSLVYNGKLSTDIIVGFPTETEEDFKDTLDLVKKVRFDSAYIFKYSPRPHTKAAEMEDDVPKEAKVRRHAELLKVQKEISNSK